MSAAISVLANNLAPSASNNSHDDKRHGEEPHHPDDDKSPEEIRQAYEELRIETEPVEAMIDPSVQFEHPEVSAWPQGVPIRHVGRQWRLP